MLRRSRRSTIEPSRPGVTSFEGATPPGPPWEQIEESSWLSHNGLQINPDLWLCTVADHAVGLTRSEFDLLLTLTKGNRRVITKNAIAAKLRGEPPGG
jgi:DNA-binding response OmpR family regulator